MDTNSVLFSQFANCAPAIGAEQPLEDAGKGPFRLMKSMQDHLVQVLGIVLERGYGIATSEDAPDVTLTGGHPNPHLGDMFALIKPLKHLGDKFAPFSTDIKKHEGEYRVKSDISEGDFRIQFRGADMRDVLQLLIKEKGLAHDEQIVRHMNIVYHILDRINGGIYKPACALH